MSDGELRAIWAATAGGGGIYDRVVRLCMLTGCRRGEIGGLRWTDIGAEWITIPPERMKGKVAHEIALLPAIAACLPARGSAEAVFNRSGATFGWFAKGKLGLDAKLAKAGHQLPQWGLHDLRRTFSTRLNDAGVEPHVVEALLGHKQPGVAAIYNKAAYRQPKREALARWHELLAGIVGETLA
jgi:integrase